MGTAISFTPIIELVFKPCRTSRRNLSISSPFTSSTDPFPLFLPFSGFRRLYFATDLCFHGCQFTVLPIGPLHVTYRPDGWWRSYHSLPIIVLISKHCRIPTRSLHPFPFSPILPTLFSPFASFRFSALIFRDKPLLVSAFITTVIYRWPLV